MVVSATCPAGILCNGGSTDVIVTATGGTAPYTGTGTFSQSAGTVTYTVTDANGCTSSTTVTLGEPAVLVASATCPAIACNGGTADIIVTVAGGTAPYTGTGTYTIVSGTYTYTVTDANGCTSSVTFTLTEPTALVATATVGALDCVSETADVTIAATGGTAPYTGTGIIVQGNGTTTYTVTDANGCTTTVSATVDVQNYVDIVCPGDQTYACNYSQNCGSQNTGSIVSWDEPTASSFSTCDNGCGPNTAISGFIYMGEYNGSRYYCSNSSNFSWQAANNAATIAGGHLATISSSAENQFVSGAIGANVAWIGYTDQNVEGVFEWINGESVGYENWGGNEPNNNGPTANNCGYCGEADYTVIKKNSGVWYDRYECNLNEFVMEIPCGNPITITQTGGPASGTFLNGGTSQVVTYVATDNVTGASATCSFTVTVEDCAPVYCESSASCSAYEWINQVCFGTINNVSGNNGGYADFTNMTHFAQVGEVINVSLHPGFSGATYQENWRVWIDWNIDGDFDDAGELYQGYGVGNMYAAITVPNNAVNGSTRVRISMRWGCAYAPSCGTYYYGEVEDYTLSIFSANSMSSNSVPAQANQDPQKYGDAIYSKTDNNSRRSFPGESDAYFGGRGLELGDIYPNPVLSSNGIVNLEMRSGIESSVTVRVYDLSGKVMLTEAIYLETGVNKSQIDVTGFARGSYVIEVVSGDVKETTQLIVQ